jgi:hypothetical protein
MADMNTLIMLLKTSENYFEQIKGDADWRDGWKLSIQGKTLEDSRYLLKELVGLLVATKASFKFATQKLIDLDSEQSTKLLTIYVPNNVEIKSYAELVRLNILDYEGANGIENKKSYEKYSNGIFYRNDRNKNGKYIPA